LFDLKIFCTTFGLGGGNSDLGEAPIASPDYATGAWSTVFVVWSILVIVISFIRIDQLSAARRHQETSINGEVQVVRQRRRQRKGRRKAKHL